MKKKLRLSTSILRKAGASPVSIPSYWDAESAADEYHTHYKPAVKRILDNIRQKSLEWKRRSFTGARDEWGVIPRDGQGRRTVEPTYELQPHDGPDIWQTHVMGEAGKKNPDETDMFAARFNHVVRALHHEGILSPIRLAEEEVLANPLHDDDGHNALGHLSLSDIAQLHGTERGHAAIAQHGGRILVHVKHKLANGKTIRIPFYFSTGEGDKDRDDKDHERVPNLSFYTHAGSTPALWVHKDAVSKDQRDNASREGGMTNNYHNPVIAYYQGVLNSTLAPILRDYAVATKKYGWKTDDNADASFPGRLPDQTCLRGIVPDYAQYNDHKDSDRDGEIYNKDIGDKLSDDTSHSAQARYNDFIQDWMDDESDPAAKLVRDRLGGVDNSAKGTRHQNGFGWGKLLSDMYFKIKGIDRRNGQKRTSGAYFNWLSKTLNQNKSKNKDIEQNGIRMPDVPHIGAGETHTFNPSKGLTEQHPMIAAASKAVDVGKKFGSDLMSRLTPKAPQSPVPPSPPSPTGQPASKSFSPFPFAIWSPAYT